MQTDAGGRNRTLTIVILCLTALIGMVGGEVEAKPSNRLAAPSLPCCEYEGIPGFLHAGPRNEMSFQDIVAYAAPILWFSPDEPLLEGRSGRDINIPTSFPFEDSTASPVVYYRVRRILERPDVGAEAVQVDPADRARSSVRMDLIVGMDIDFFFYYPSEAGLGSHKHDVESVEMKLLFGSRPDCPADCRYGFVVDKVVGKAHGMLWYDNTLTPSAETRFPIHVLVEEGKHASCPDANGDGNYTPSYDVTERINDAWGVRDIIRGGALYTGGFQSWMAKDRHKENRVFPPLPADSYWRERLDRDAPPASRATYELRPFPSAEAASPDLVPFIAGKGDPDWPAVEKMNALSEVADWTRSEAFVKSVSVAYRYDGDHGVSVTFPLFIVRPFNEPMGGGWINNRIYLKDDKLRDLGWQLQYTPSASRWVDPYFSAGIEWDEHDDGGKVAYGVIEQGIKFRATVSHSPLKFLGKLTDFWGVRFGLKARGLMPVQDWNYVIEIGAGTF